MTLSRAARIEGGIVGALVGDALGVPYEFHDAQELPQRIEMTPPEGFDRAHRDVPPGTWSDDGAQLLCLLESLLAHPTFSPDDFSARLLGWYEVGHMAVDGIVFDVGIQTGQALRALKAGVAPLDAGPKEERSNGNGSLMRVLPVAFFGASHRERIALAELQSRVTHGHARSRICCQLYVAWAALELEGTPDAFGGACMLLDELTPKDGELREALDFQLRPTEAIDGRGGGYVIDAMRSARDALARTTSYEEAVTYAVKLGDDTDTTACLAGGIAGIRYGIEAIPSRWRAALRGGELVQPLLEMLLERSS